MDVATLPEKYSNSETYTVWAGSEDSLRRILRQIEGRFTKFVPSHVESSSAHELYMWESAKDRVKRLEGTTRYRGDDEKEYEETLASARLDEQKALQSLEAQRSEAAKAAELTLTWSGKGNEVRTVTGSADELVDYIDGRYIYEAEFEAPSGHLSGKRIALRGNIKSGLHLRVSADDPEWGIAAFSELDSEIANGVPRWKWARNTPLLYLIFVVSTFIVVYFALDAIALATTESGDFGESTALVASGLGGAFAGITASIAATLTMKHIPAFEIVRHGEKAKGRVLYGAMLGAVGAIILGVVSSAIAGAIFG